MGRWRHASCHTRQIRSTSPLRTRCARTRLARTHLLCVGAYVCGPSTGHKRPQQLPWWVSGAVYCLHALLGHARCVSAVSPAMRSTTLQGSLPINVLLAQLHTTTLPHPLFPPEFRYMGHRWFDFWSSAVARCAGVQRGVGWPLIPQDACDTGVAQVGGSRRSHTPRGHAPPGWCCVDATAALISPWWSSVGTQHNRQEHTLSPRRPHAAHTAAHHNPGSVTLRVREAPAGAPPHLSQLTSPYCPSRRRDRHAVVVCGGQQADRQQR
jgi:hypothetical protein